MLATQKRCDDLLAAKNAELAEALAATQAARTSQETAALRAQTASRQTQLTHEAELEKLRQELQLVTNARLHGEETADARVQQLQQFAHLRRACSCALCRSSAMSASWSASGVDNVEGT